MIWIVFLVAALAVLVVLPFITEALRKPLDDSRRGSVGGSFIELSKGTTHYQWHGPRSDRVLVLIHGVTTPSWVFQGLIRGLLMMHFHVLAYDLYGRGTSDRVKGRQDLDFFTGQLRELLDGLGLRHPVSLMGYSLGGAIATAFAAAEPDRVERLILLAPAGVSYRPTRFMRFVRGQGPLGTWLWALAGGVFLQRVARKTMEKPTVIPDLPDRMAFEINTAGTLPAMLSAERHALTEDLESSHRELAAMYIPTLVIWGKDDEVIPIEAMGRFTRWNRQAHQEMVPGAGHGLVHQNPKEVIGAIHAFLKDVPNV